jgi:hypothetical protein
VFDPVVFPYLGGGGGATANPSSSSSSSSAAAQAQAAASASLNANHFHLKLFDSQKANGATPASIVPANPVDVSHLPPSAPSNGINNNNNNNNIVVAKPPFPMGIDCGHAQLVALISSPIVPTSFSLSSTTTNFIDSFNKTIQEFQLVTQLVNKNLKVIKFVRTNIVKMVISYSRKVKIDKCILKVITTTLCLSIFLTLLLYCLIKMDCNPHLFYFILL